MTALRVTDPSDTATTPSFVVGIDLGTSNTAVAYAELHPSDLRSRDGRRQPTIEAFEILQLIQPGDLQARRLLPSAHYAPSEFEVQAADTYLPWSNTPSDAPLEVLGECARRLGAKTPIRLIESSKSWLCHGGVNRTAHILPWHAPEEVPKRSPVDVATALLRHIRAAWDHQIAENAPHLRLEHQHLVLTVPASFDEAARRLTTEAAHKAGLNRVQLLEEPLAAFYAYIARTGGTTATTGLKGNEQVLIADVGGGTTDFTLIRVQPSGVEDSEEENLPLNFERTAVGEHLLLGGDNMDLALAHAIEPELSSSKSGKSQQRLDAEAWAQLKSECRNAKEVLFTHLEHTNLPIKVAGRSRKLLGNLLKTELSREQLERVVLEGYFPELPPGEAAQPENRRGGGFTEYGLPYATDPRITRHLAQFLLEHATQADGKNPRVDAILFNGGALKPVLIRDRITKIIGDWLRGTNGNHQVPDPRALVWDEGETALELAVARGAAYFGLVRQGQGLKIRGGSPRSYYLGLGLAPEESIPDTNRKLVCIAPRGMQDGQSLELAEREFQLVTNRPVMFPLFASSSARKDIVGTVLQLPVEELHELPPLQTVVKFGKQKTGTQVPVRIQVHRTEVGTLELSCLSKMSGSRFKLEFDLRGSKSASVEDGSFEEESIHRAPPESGDVPAERLETAKERLIQTFSPQPTALPAQLMKGLESDLALERDAFPLSTLRSLAEQLLDVAEYRSLTPELEARWLNVTGFSLRPGFGVPLDDWRVRQLWRIHSLGPTHQNHSEVALNWWILWRRVAGGLSRGPQDELTSRLFPLLIPSQAKRAKRKPPKPQSQEAAEMWRAAAALEHISAKQRTVLGGALMDLLETKRAPKGALWCLSRIGARRLLYGPRESTVKASTIETWLDRIYATRRRAKDEHPTSLILALARCTGDRQLDLSDAARLKADAYLESLGVPDTTRRPLRELVQIDQSTQSDAFGDSLPAGLSLG